MVVIAETDHWIEFGFTKASYALNNFWLAITGNLQLHCMDLHQQTNSNGDASTEC
jgi:hypothetical protein